MYEAEGDVFALPPFRSISRIPASSLLAGAAKNSLDETKSTIASDALDVVQKKSLFAHVLAVVRPPFSTPSTPREANTRVLQYTAAGRASESHAAGR